MTPAQEAQLATDVDALSIGERTDLVNELAGKLEAPQLARIEGVFGKDGVAHAVETHSPRTVREDYAALSAGKPAGAGPHRFEDDDAPQLLGLTGGAPLSPAAQANGTTQTTEHIGENTVTWTNDSQGRPIRAEADLTEVFTGIDRSSAETRAQREAADRGVEGDQGGHLIGHRFVKDQGLKNLFPQNGNFNVGAYKKLENEWADWIDSGKDVHITVELTPAEADRPEQVHVSYEVTDPTDGSVVYDQRVTFRNEAGQTFDRVPRQDM
ncbi:DNA/RNA non-specific endonuclease [Luteimonas aquatica]|uniref:DNA/RNA non-specific endonuclease n=1 Tax=Luteimonas aquatica TaxID=450364 RepID=UPI001F5ABFC0|nr:DNA/RNA non-specific endonuclease [Luteimonas aquatica]